MKYQQQKRERQLSKIRDDLTQKQMQKDPDAFAPSFTPKINKLSQTLALDKSFIERTQDWYSTKNERIR